MIEIKNLKKIWEDDGSSVLEGINLKIEDGDIYASRTETYFEVFGWKDMILVADG